MALIFIDQVSKNYFFNSGEVFLNSGMIGGFLGEAPASLRVVTLSTLGATCIAIYLILLIVTQFKMLGYSLSLVASGMSGNIIDRVRLGKSIDFIFLGPWVFNLADIFLWTGSIISIYLILRFSKEIWLENDQRRIKILYFKDQMRFATLLTLFVVGVCLILGILSYSYFNTQLKFGHDYVMRYYFLTFISLSFFLIICMFFLGLYLSQKIAGPIYALNAYIERGDQSKKFQLRTDDYFKNIEDIIEKIYGDKDL